MSNELNLTGMTEQEKSDKAAELRQQAQRVLNQANIIESAKPISTEEQQLVNQIKDIAAREAIKIPQGLDIRPAIPEVGKIKVLQEPIPIKPIEALRDDETGDIKDGQFGVIGRGDGRAKTQVHALFNDKSMSGKPNDEQRDCSQCEKWSFNHCLVATPAPRDMKGHCEYYVELKQLRGPVFVVQIYCPICSSHLGNLDISAPVKSARCDKCETDIAGIWLSRTFVIKDLRNGETNSNAEIREKHTQSPGAIGKD